MLPTQAPRALSWEFSCPRLFGLSATSLRCAPKLPALDCVNILEHKTYFTQSTLYFQLKKECCNKVIQNSRQTHRNVFYLRNTLHNLFCKRSTYLIQFTFGNYCYEFTLPGENLELHRVLVEGIKGETGEREDSLKQESWSSKRKGLCAKLTSTINPH